MEAKPEPVKQMPTNAKRKDVSKPKAPKQVFDRTIFTLAYLSLVWISLDPASEPAEGY